MGQKGIKVGDVSLLGAGQDAWVIGDEPVVVVDFQGVGEKGSMNNFPILYV